MSSFPTESIYNRTFVAIDLSAIDNNICQIKASIDDGVKVMAIVKADAYGHGSVAVASHISDRVDYFAVADIEEAIELREGGIEKPILILSYTAPAFYDEIIERNITATIYNLEEAQILNRAAEEKNKKVKIHIAVDTGMGRIGFAPDEKSADIIKEISNLPHIEIEGLFSHFACADCEDKSVTVTQTELFDRFIGLLEERGISISIKHICNSAGTINLNKKYDMCRIGITLYGLYPSEEVNTGKMSLIPAMSVISHVVHVKDVPKGFKIGYGHDYEAPSPKKIATVSIGYADGYNRCLSNKGFVIINGKKAPVVGKVCMDMIMVDVTDIPDVHTGMRAIIIGEDKGVSISAEEFGELSGSFNYEVICNFMPRVKRFYHINGRPVK